MKVENGKLKIVVGQTVCKMQIIVARLFLYIEVVFKCRGEPCSPVRVHTKLKHNIHYIKKYVGKQKDRKIAFSTLN